MNNNNSILLIDPAFDPSMASACNLLVKIGIDNFSYAIINKSTLKLVGLFDEQECSNNLLNLSDRLDKDPYLNLPFKETKVIIYTEDEISIPNDIFDENSIELHSKLIKNHSSINLFKQDKFRFTTVFGLNKLLKELIINKLSHSKLYPHYAGLLALTEDAKENHLFLDFSVNSFTALFIKDEKVIFQKCYETEDIQELNYFILLLINQLNINTTDVNISLSGIIQQEDKKYKCLQKYFNRIEFLKLDTELRLGLVEDMPKHYYSNLLALGQCE